MALKDPLRIIGETVAEKYVIERACGEGGFAVVYRAQHTIWKKPVAIKFFSELSSIPSDQREENQGGSQRTHRASPKARSVPRLPRRSCSADLGAISRETGP